VFFVVSGTHTVHLTGNYVIDDSEETDSEEDDEYDLPPDEMEDLVGDSDDEDYESDELDGIDIADRIQELVEEEEDEEAPALVPSKKGKNKRPAEDSADGLDDMIAEESTTAADEPKLSKKQQKKLKNNKGQAVEVEETVEIKVKPAAKDSKTNGTPKSDKKVQFAKNLEQGPTGSAEKAKATDSKASIGVKVVQGVTIDDRKIGTGRTVKSGDKVGMRYIGKLQNGKVFDCKSLSTVRSDLASC
jgi:FK506-binding nuclear protein